MGIMILKKEGKLDYEDSLSKYFPQFPSYAEQISIKQLMNHTSGIKDQYKLGIYKKGLTNQEVFNVLITKELDFKPGTKYRYSNGAYVLLAMIIEKVSGQPLQDFMKQQIFIPLGMKKTYVVHPKTKHLKDRAIGFSTKKVADNAMGNDYELYTTGAGGIYSTVTDLLKWDQALYTDQLVPQSYLKEAFQVTPLKNGAISDYGYGWGIIEKDKIVGHTGSLNGFRNVIERDIVNNRSIIALTNNTADYRNDLRDGLRKILKEYAPIILKNGNIIDVENGKVIKNQHLYIEDGKIKKIEKGNQQKFPAAATIIDANGKYIMPGMVDAHIHFFQSGGLYTRPDAIDLRKYRPYEEEIEWLKAATDDILQRYLKAGITTVVDVGGPMHNFKIKAKHHPNPLSPSIYLTGPLVSTYQPPELAVGDAPIIKVTNEAEAIAMVQKQAAEKADFIKIWYIAFKRQDALDNYPIIEATVNEAKKHGLPVAVHATQLSTAKLALKAGTDLLVHSVDDALIDEEFIELMKKQNTVYLPTLIVSDNYTKVFTQSFEITADDYHYGPPKPLGSLLDLKHLPEPEIINQYLGLKEILAERGAARHIIKEKNLKMLVDAGIPIALGTDAGNIGTMHVSSYFKELESMQKAGMNTAQLLQAMTLNGAKAVGKAADFGKIAAGQRADLLVLENNPLADIMGIKSIQTIINKGNIIHQENLAPNSPEDLAQQQLNAYNGHNLEAFLEPYAENVKIYNFPNELSLEGKEAMRKGYQFIERSPDLHCELVNRIVMGNTVIDQERVIFNKDRPPLHAVAIYKIKNGKIAEVYFIKK
jgi:imidazolonepropionase-like amidohydrolase